LEQQPRSPQFALSDGIDGKAGAAVTSNATTLEAGVSWVTDTAARACGWPAWAEAIEGASEKAARTAAAPKIRANCSFKAIFSI
jgi:hypothetical protein